VIRERSVTLLVGLALILSPAFFAQEKETVEQIMAKVAANQDRSQDMRTAFVYHQDVLLRFKRGNGKIAREESREYTVTPSSKGSQKNLTHFLGKYEKDGRLIEIKNRRTRRDNEYCALTACTSWVERFLILSTPELS